MPHKNRILITLIILVFLSVGIYIGKNAPPVQLVAGFFQDLLSSPKSLLYQIGKNERDERIKKLIQENLTLKEKVSEFELMKKDNDALKSQFQTSGETSMNMTAAKIIGYQGNSRFPQEFVINVGRKNSIQKGMTVVFQKYLVGRVTEVSDAYSVVITPLSHKFKALAKLTTTTANGLIIGQNDFMLLEGVIITDTLTKDGIVVTKGEVDRNGVGILPDIIIGKITTISKSETAPFQSAQVTPIIDFSKLTNVFVITQM